MKSKEELTSLINAHFSYIENLLLSHGESDIMIDLVKFHYCSAFEHGYKHAVQDFESLLSSNT
jgi:hypothetical protein